MKFKDTTQSKTFARPNSKPKTTQSRTFARPKRHTSGVRVIMRSGDGLSKVRVAEKHDGSQGIEQRRMVKHHEYVRQKKHGNDWPDPQVLIRRRQASDDTERSVVAKPALAHLVAHWAGQAEHVQRNKERIHKQLCQRLTELGHAHLQHVVQIVEVVQMFSHQAL